MYSDINMQWILGIRYNINKRSIKNAIFTSDKSANPGIAELGVSNISDKSTRPKNILFRLSLYREGEFFVIVKNNTGKSN